MSQNNANERHNEEGPGQQGRGKPSAGVIGGAAVIGAGVGALIGGPLIAIGLGATAAGLSLTDNKAGDVARSTGRAGMAVVNKGKELNQRYGFGEKVDREQHPSERADEAIGGTTESVYDALSQEDKPDGKESKPEGKK